MDRTSPSDAEDAPVGRRTILRIGAIGGGLALLALARPAARAAEAMLLSCMDHRDCGAYKVLLGEDFSKDRAKETAVHAEKLRELRTRINAKHPKLEVELLLMNLDGTVEKIA